MPTCTRSPLSRPTASRLFPRPAFCSRRRQPSQRSGRTPAKPTDADAAVTDTTELTLTLTLTPTLTLTLTLTLTRTLALTPSRQLGVQHELPPGRPA